MSTPEDFIGAFKNPPKNKEQAIKFLSDALRSATDSHVAWSAAATEEFSSLDILNAIAFAHFKKACDGALTRVEASKYDDVSSIMVGMRTYLEAILLAVTEGGWEIRARHSSVGDGWEPCNLKGFDRAFKLDDIKEAEYVPPTLRTGEVVKYNPAEHVTLHYGKKP